jgi:hypothetical protein
MSQLEITGTILGIISLCLGIFIVCVGPKTIKDWIIDVVYMIWWLSIFGTWRYKWLLDEKTKINLGERGNISQIDKIFRRVLLSWNPESPQLKFLDEGICKYREGAEIFPLELICKCVYSMNYDIKYIVAWEIIENCRLRLLPPDSHHFDVKCYEQTASLLTKWINECPLPPFSIQFTLENRHDGTLNKFGKDVENKVKRVIADEEAKLQSKRQTEPSIQILFYMASLLVNIKKILPSPSGEIRFDYRKTLYLHLLSKELFTILLGSFNLTQFILDKYPDSDDSWNYSWEP